MKSCAKCERVLPLECFARNAKNDDGLATSCRECMRAYRIQTGRQKPDGWERKTADKRAYAQAWRAANKDKVRVYERRKKKRTPEYERRKYAAKMRRERVEGYVVGDPANRKSPTRIGLLTPAEKLQRRAARVRTRRYVAAGKLQKWPCEVCGHEDSEAHHVAYDKPLLVVWLCHQHHREVHGG